MWPRVVELMLGLWLLASPFIFQHGDAGALWKNDLACGFLVITFSCMSFAKKLRRAHLATLGLGLWLASFGYFYAPHPLPGAAQNAIVVGLLLVMIGVVPSEASTPPRGWRDNPS